MKTLLFFLSATCLSFAAKSAELFIRVTKQGTYNAIVYNQAQTNPVNIFRFFDLPAGSVNVQVLDQQTGAFLYNSTVYLTYNQHISAEIDMYGNFLIVQNTTVASMNWPLLVYSGGMNTNNTNNNGVFPQSTSANTDGFTQFLVMLDNEGFDSGKLTKAKNYINKGNLSAQQITDISKKFSFDSNRLDWAKYAYSKCYDKANYFRIKNTFVFQSNYADLEKYIETQ